MAGLVEAAWIRRLALRGTQMGEEDMASETLRHGDHIDARVDAIRTGTEREAIGRTRRGIKYPLHVLRVGNHARQAEQWPWRIIGMNRHAYARRLRDGHDRLQEIPQMPAQALAIHIGVCRQRYEEALKSVVLLRARQPGIAVVCH